MDDKSKPGPKAARVAQLTREEWGDSSLVKAGELIEARFARGQTASLAARRAYTLMLAEAQLNPEPGQTYQIRKKTLRGLRKSDDRISTIMSEVLAAQFTIPRLSTRGRAAISAVNIFERITTEFDDGEEEGLVEYQLTATAAKIISGSSRWGHINRAALFAFESKYALTLYEIGCLHCGKSWPTLKLTVEELDERLGVQGKYPDFAQFNRRVLAPAVSEINQIAHFEIVVERIIGPRRKVVGISLHFFEKDGRGINRAAEIISAHRVVRRGLRSKNTEKIIETASEAADDIFDQGDDDEIPW